MAKKRVAIADLNHDNWDDEEDPGESGVFKTAPEEELQKREIRTARRRRVAGQDSAKTSANTSLFGAFSGFNKTAPSSFDFLSKLTNGASSFGANGSPSQKNSTVECVGSSPIASSTAIIGNSPSSERAKSLFGVASNSAIKSVATSQEDNSTTGSSNPSTMFGMPPTPSAATSIFKSSTNSGSTSLTFGIPPKFSPAQESKTLTCGVQKLDTQTTKNESAFDKVPSVSNPFKLPSGSVSSIFNTESKVPDSVTPAKRSKCSEKDTSSPTSQTTTEYYSKLKGLNESVSDWIKKHVNENPLCILTPIFKDYEKYLKELEDEREANEGKVSVAGDIKKCESINPIISSRSTTPAPTSHVSKPSGFSLTTSVPFSFGISSVSTAASNGKTLTSAPLSFGISSASTTNTNSTSSTPAPFSFGISSTSAVTSTQAPFSFGTVSSNTTGTNITSSAPEPFSFGIGSTFSFNANVQKPPDTDNQNEAEDDKTPKVEFTPIEEENSVFDKKCKIFFKKDGNFIDKGIGTLYIKKTDKGSKHQLIVRANTSLGTLILNFILNESIPMQRMGKNNVLVVCIPTPDAKYPTHVLIRVKTSEEADELLETLNKFKK